MTDGDRPKVISQKIKEIIELLQVTLRDAEKAEIGNESAGVRVRKDSLGAIKVLKELRQDILDIRKEDD